jgi:tetratricopeptide (TPR) repeat protein
MLAAILLLATLQQMSESYEFATAVQAGAPADLEQRAWYVTALLHVDGLEAERVAEEMRATHPESPWTWLALAQVYQDDPDHLDDNKLIAEKLANETREELAIARAIALRSVMQPEAALKVLDALPATPRVLVAKAGIFQTKQNGDEQAIAAFREALKLDPENLPALARLGAMLKQLRRRDEATPLLERAAKMSPYVMATQLPNAAALEAWIDESGGDPFVLSVASRGFRQLKMDDRVCELQDRILREAPASPQALNVLLSRARSRPTLLDVLNYPYRNNPEAIASASFSLLRDETEDQQLIKLVHAIPLSVQYVGQVAMALQKLADRKLDLEYAESTARELPALNERDLLSFAMEAADMRERVERTSRATMRDTLGWVLLARGKVKESQKELIAARVLFPESSTITYHLGRSFEAQQMTTKAEQLYREGLSLQTNGVNLNRGGLEALYRRKHKSLDGFEAYLKHVNTTGESASRERVLATRIAKPVSAPEFKLKSLDGKTVSLADLKGKVAVVNFWGVWCGWCLKEMPDFAKLAKLYEKDEQVRILTVDTDSDPAVVKQWMATNHHDFAVLLDDGWVHRAGVSAFPTTWFLDPRGRIAFKKEGWTEKLVDQFSWRIDVLKK